jgi:hypothetical protein
MKNIIAKRIPTFSTSERGAAVRLFSNLIKASSRKKIEAAIKTSSKRIKLKVSGVPKNILNTNTNADAMKKNCAWVLTIFCFTIFNLSAACSKYFIIYQLK